MNPTTNTGTPLNCRRCGTELGRDMGNRVRVGRVSVFQRVVLTCECGYKRQFRPAQLSPARGRETRPPTPGPST